MSYIYFHSPEGRAKVRGSERLYMAHLTSRLLVATLSMSETRGEGFGDIIDFIPKGHYLLDCYRECGNNLYNPTFLDRFKTWIHAESDGIFEVSVFKASVFETKLNTAYVLANDVIKLMSRLHGQCELHCYVEAKNRKWLSGIITKGLKGSILRNNQGWKSVIQLLESGSQTPVVCSYSVSYGFPNTYVAGVVSPGEYMDDSRESAWYDLSEVERWDLAIQGIRSENGLELKPEGWEDFYFGYGWDAFKVNEILALPKSEWENAVKTLVPLTV